MYKCLLLLLAIAGCFSLELNGQDYLMDGSPITDCQGSFYDSGGRIEGYLPGEEWSTLICSDETTGAHTKLDFFDLNLGSGDYLMVYDGMTSDNDLLLQQFDHTSKAPFSVQSTVVNTSGCLLVLFQSDEEEEGRGWRTKLECIPNCQLIENAVVTNPVAEEGFIDICVGEQVVFFADPIFSQNGLLYEQSAENCTYNWLFSDREKYTGREVNRAFEQPGSYWGRLEVEDHFGCVNTEFLDIEIRVSPGLSYEVSKLSKNAYCWGDTVAIQTIVGELPEETLGVGMLPVTITEVSQQTESFTEVIPDANGSVYERRLIVNDYPEGFTFGELEDFQGIYLNLEHSYSGDLDIEVTCPDGITVLLLDNSDWTGSTNFGIPTPKNTIMEHLPGVGYDYFFLDGAENGTLGEFDAPICEEFANTCCFEPFNYMDYCFPAGNYAPSTPLTSLSTCSMNGEWILRIEDHISQDNGWVFGWGLSSSSSIPKVADVIAVEDYGWENDPAILWETPDVTLVLPEQTGVSTFNFLMEDAYGCEAEASVSISVVDNSSDCLFLSSSELLTGHWQLYPNPTQTELTIVPDGEENWAYTVYTAAGQVIRTGQHRGQLDLSTAQWPTGMYFVNIVQDGRQQSWKVVKE